MPHWLEQVLGASLVLVVLLDVFLTVLYARIGTGLISNRLARLTWRLFLGLAKLSGPRSRATVLSFCGPIILVLLLLAWALGLTFGAALIMHPDLGTSIRAGSGGTPTDFVAALYAAGSSFAIVGASDFMPQTSATRLLYLLNSLVGLSIISLTLSYLVQVYTALQQRNVLGLKVYFLASGTGDAAELITGLGAGGDFSSGYTNLADLAVEMTNVAEAHHFYATLFYFRFHDVRYSVSRISLVALDTVTLIKSALDDERYGWLKETASVAQLWQVSMLLVKKLEATFLPGGVPEASEPPDAQAQERWRRRYAAALPRLRQAGIKTVADEQAGAETYVLLRAGWDRYVAALAPSMAYEMDDVDPAGSAAVPAQGQQHAAYGRLHPVG